MMLSLTTKSATGSRAIPRHLTTLSVSWLNEQFKAVAVHRGVVGQSWAREELCDAPDKFEAFIRDAVRETGFEGQTISIVLAHPRLVQQLVEVPPVKGSTLRQLIQRQAQQQRIFPGDAGWASQVLPANKTNARVLLHLFPKLILNQLALAAKRNGLYLTSVLPASTVLQQQLTALPLEKDDIAMLAAETGGATTVVVGGANGRLFLSRTLQDSWNQDPTRLAVDLNRTLSFASQQFNLTINKGLWLFGSGAAEAIEAIRGQVPFPVALSPVPDQPFFWATNALQLREDAPNFITPEVQKAPQRRVFAKVVAAGTTLLLAGALALTTYSLLQSRQEMATLQSFTQQAARVEARQRELEQRDNEMKRKQQAIRLVLGERPAPTPAWLLAYLGQALPADLVITNFSIQRETDFYRLKLAGTHQLTPKHPQPPPLSESLATLESRLAGRPFFVQVVDTNAVGKAESADAAHAKAAFPRIPVAEWVNRVTSRILPPKPVEADHFMIEGVLR